MFEPDRDRPLSDLSTKHIQLPEYVVEKVAFLQRVASTAHDLIKAFRQSAFPYFERAHEIPKDAPFQSREHCAMVVNRLAFVLAALSEDTNENAFECLHTVNGAIEAGFLEFPSDQLGFFLISNELAKALRLMGKDMSNILYRAACETGNKELLLRAKRIEIPPSVELSDRQAPQQFVLRFQGMSEKGRDSGCGFIIPVSAITQELGEERTDQAIDRYFNIYLRVYKEISRLRVPRY